MTEDLTTAEIQAVMRLFGADLRSSGYNLAYEIRFARASTFIRASVRGNELDPSSVEVELVSGSWQLAHLIDSLQDDVSETVDYGTAWPLCPAHGVHPLNLDWETRSWRCARGDVSVPLGQLGSDRPGGN